MSALLARIMLVIFMLPSAAIVYVVTFAATEQARRYASYPLRMYVMWLAAGVVTTFFIVAYWLAVWCRTVRWTPERVTRTIGASVLALLCGVTCAFFIWPVEDDLGLFVGTSVTPILWLIFTTLVWKETASERADRISRRSGDSLACPTCGYNLTGLKGTRCPECGSDFTLEELLAAGRERAGQDLV